MHCYAAETINNTIVALYARHIETGEEKRFPATLFADCTGDGTIGYLAGAEYRLGRESRTLTGEPTAPEKADTLTMGFSNPWRALQKSQPSTFPICPWALQFSNEYYLDETFGEWYWESGFAKDQLNRAEEIRDHNLRAIYGNWSFLKNNKPEKYAYWQLDWVAYVAGKRESRRLMGDLVLQEQDIVNGKEYPDAMVTATWSIDLHYPQEKNSKYFPGNEFISQYNHPKYKPYHIPYRCLYSKNISNLFMAGRNISVTHVALGAVRVMRTTGMMGEAVGYAAYLCKKHTTTPRMVYEKYLDEFIQILTTDPLPCK